MNGWVGIVGSTSYNFTKGERKGLALFNGLFACTRAGFDIVEHLIVGFFTIAKLATTCCKALMSAMKADRPAYSLLVPQLPSLTPASFPEKKHGRL